MSRSLSLGAPPVTKACASTTARVPAGRAARSARTSSIAAPSTAACPPLASPNRSRTSVGSRYGSPYTATGPCASASTTGSAHWPGSVRRWIPARPIRPAPTPSRRAESWLPLMNTVGTPRSASRCSTSSNIATASSPGSARS